MLSNLFGWKYSEISIPRSRELSVLLKGCELSTLKPDPIWNRTVLDAFSWTYNALTKLHPKIEKVIAMDFEAPEFSETLISNYVQVGFADPLKHICIPLCGLPYYVLLGIDATCRAERERPICEINSNFWHSSMSGRQILECVGTECFRSLDDQIWVKLAQRRILGYMKMLHSVVVSDVRFKNEAEMIRNLGGSILVLARSESDLLLTESDRQTHVSKWEFLTFIDRNRDVTLINNSSIEELLEKLNNVLDYDHVHI